MTSPNATQVASSYGIYFGLIDTKTRTMRRLDGIRALATGWHYGEGNPPAAETVHVVEQLYEAAAMLGLRTDVFPVVDGSVMLAVYLRDRLLEFVAMPDGAFTVYQEIDGEEVEPIEGIDFAGAKQLLRRNAPGPWISSDSYTEAITTVSSGASSPKPSRPLGMESLWSASIAWREATSQFVSI